MRKTDKKIERDIIRTLTELCEAAKFDHEGFIWLTHDVDYRRWPQSLKVTLVFDESLSEEQLFAEFKLLLPKVQQALESIIGETLPAKQIEARSEHTLH